MVWGRDPPYFSPRWFLNTTAHIAHPFFPFLWYCTHHMTSFHMHLDLFLSSIFSLMVYLFLYEYHVFKRTTTMDICVCLVALVVSNSLWLYGMQPTRLLCPWGSPGKNTGGGCLALLQGIFPTQGSNLGLLHCRKFLYRWATREAHSHW